MAWNYRAISEVIEGETVCRVYEVYYDEGGEIDGWTAKPAYPQGESLNELRSNLIMMLRDVDFQRALDMADLRERFPDAGRAEGAKEPDGA